MKRILAFLLTVTILLSSLTFMAFGATAASITINPSVFVGGEIYNVVWATNVASIGYIEYAVDGVTYRLYDEKGGVVRTDDNIHSVSVPKEHLDAAGSYTVYSQAVTSRTGFNVTLYGSVVSATRTFKGYSGQSEINAWTVTDPHGLNHTTIKNAINNLSCKNPDLVYFLGDMITFATYKYVSSNSSSASYWNHSLCYIFRLAETLTGGSIPVVYARGNHETRSKYSTYLTEYLAGDTGELYFDYTYGPISSIVLDFGEDKVDTHHEYTGFASFENYHRNQTAWLGSLQGFPQGETDTVYRLAVCHGQQIKNHFGNNWAALLGQYGSDLMISGHTHRLTMHTPVGYELASYTTDTALTDLVYGTETDDGTTSTTKMVQYEQTSSHMTNYPVYINGCHFSSSTGTAHFIASQLTFKNGQIITTTATDQQAVGTTFTVNAGLNTPVVSDTETVEFTPGVYKTPDYYETNNDNKVGSTSTPDDTTFKMVTKPAVFATSEDYYTVVWATEEGKSATGEVRVHDDGTVYKFTDDISGYYRIASNMLDVTGTNTGKNIHAVKVPKKYLEKGKYECVSRHLMNVDYTNNLELGIEVSTGLIDFDGYDFGESVEMLTISQWENQTDMLSKVRSVAKTSDVIVAAGNIADNMQTAADLMEMIYDLGALSSGKKPIFFLRGGNEVTGTFAEYLINNIRFSTGEFFDKVTFGPVSALLIDAPAYFADNSSYYNGLAAFSSVRTKQLDWLKKQDYEDAEYKVALSFASDLTNNVGYNYAKVLNNLGTDIAISAGTGSSTFAQAGVLNQNYATVQNGSYAVDGTIGTRITFANGTIKVEALKEGGVISTNTVDPTAAAAAAYADVAEAAWYGKAVSYVSNQRLMVGTGADTFSPDTKVTRAQAAVVLANLAKADLDKVDAVTPFEDIDENAYYAKAAAWCYQNGVTYGTSATTFAPDAELTREMLCALIYNMYESEFEKADTCDFTDFDAVSDWAKTAVASLANAGVVSGIGGGKFAPSVTIDRASLAQVLYQADF